MKEKFNYPNEETRKNLFDRAFDEMIWEKSPEYREAMEKQKALEGKIKAKEEEMARKEEEYKKKIEDLNRQIGESLRRHGYHR